MTIQYDRAPDFRVFRSFCLAGVGMAFSTMAATAEECTAPCLDTAFTLELQADWIFDATPPPSKSTSLEPTLTLDLLFRATEAFSFVGSITAENISESPNAAGFVSDGPGAYIGEVFGQYETDPFSFRVGKFDPDFSLASAALSDLYGTDIVGDYDAEERWGVQASVPFEAASVSHAVTVNLFTTDRTVLNRSIGSQRPRLTLADGGAGNVEGIGSAGIFYDFCSGAEAANCFEEGDAGGRFGLRYQKAGAQTEEQIDEEIVPADEIGYLGAVTKRFSLSDSADLILLGEVAYFRNFESAPEDALFSTATAAIESGPLTYTATFTNRKTEVFGEPDATDELIALGVIFRPAESAFGTGASWILDAGLAFLDTADGEEENRLGLRATLEF
ncbi:hypothetical protein R5H32_00885 [Defluviimonas sp. D31]|uniref:hypothetical protein n=1 Tax=Defluviimonas sp. D31 TaxID=3083253 RepID=UPI00296FD8F6|nr:hypothetical protein [Defluviimonas sp. D31]MDW4547897.1 hypothetical protein [Defluviimonas sp. D31]